MWRPSLRTEQHSRPAVRGRGRDSAPAAGSWRIKIMDQDSWYQIKKALANLVQGDEHPDQELLVLRFEGKGEPIDDAPQDLQQLTNPVKVLRLVNKPKQA